MEQKILKFNVLFRKEPEGGYTAVVPSLSGCVTYGKNLEEAKKMASDAIEAYIASLKKHGEPIPSDEAVYITTVTLESSSKRLYV